MYLNFFSNTFPSLIYQIIFGHINVFINIKNTLSKSCFVNIKFIIILKITQYESAYCLLLMYVNKYIHMENVTNYNF